ncbi:hypothetical protein Ppb6_02323 [Photorhabdus australis subsp. thailandensis]|uniref:Uncharacterized protein n=1 Tax=Photorhabdus australis subsp. thailandensis TaxID=2805096 RepID=A0A1C0U3U0_9GAMM|nr:hypothetical protein [Photorhabdus australis]OCQ52587.1 hypothetical protein Ppb6_02323 [Photorhabdus australis subsp. thailandensis]
MTDSITFSYGHNNVVNSEASFLSFDALTQRKKFVDDSVTVLDSKTVESTFKQATSTHRDPLSLIDALLSKYIITQTKKAEALAMEISGKSKAVAEINRLWGTLMTENISKLDPTKIDKTTNIYSNSSSVYNEIDKHIRETLKDSSGINAITGGKTTVNYDQLQSMNATMTAYSDSTQVDLDKLQQDFKNMMTQITSAQEEIRDVRRAVVSFAER